MPRDKCSSCRNKQPSFNYPNEKKPLFCKDCKLDSMINVIHAKCIGCKIKHPSYNYPNDKKRLYCGDCKLEGMIDVANVNAKCIKCEIKRANFNFPNELKALFCGDCKSEGMINIKDKKCFGCKNKIPSFNYSNEKKALYCKKCKLDGMIDIISIKKLCIKCNIKMPSFNNTNETKAIYCKDCKLEGMVNIISKRCIIPLCDKKQQIDNYCYRCFYALNPNDDRCKRIKIKENEVKKFIQKEFADLSFIFDEHIKGDGLCINKRPDILLNLNKHSIIIEIDENQHKGYNIDCDISRTNKIQEALNRPIIIIRFNPDDYINENNKKITSPFIINKKLGLTTIPKNKEEEWNNRLLKLKETIIENLEYKSDEPIKIIKLFYDYIN